MVHKKESNEFIIYFSVSLSLADLTSLFYKPLNSITLIAKK